MSNIEFDEIVTAFSWIELSIGRIEGMARGLQMFRPGKEGLKKVSEAIVDEVEVIDSSISSIRKAINMDELVYRETDDYGLSNEGDTL